MVQKKRKIGLFGGTFNPIHLGHLRGAEEVRECCGLDEIIFIPAATPPHKEAGEVIEATHRLEMLRLATRTNPHFSVSTVELERRGTSYSIDTIRFFLEKDQGALSFILGRDAFVEIETWREYPTLFSLCSFIVMARPGVGDPSWTDSYPRPSLQHSDTTREPRAGSIIPVRPCDFRTLRSWTYRLPKFEN